MVNKFFAILQLSQFQISIAIMKSAVMVAKIDDHLLSDRFQIFC